MTNTNNSQELYSIGYGRFPYLIIRNACGIYTQIPVLIEYSSVSREGIIVPLQDLEDLDELIENVFISWIDIISGRPVYCSNRVISEPLNSQTFSTEYVEMEEINSNEACLVLGKDSCYYFSLNHPSITFSDSIPKGGCLLSLNFERIKFHEGNHFYHED